MSSHNAHPHARHDVGHVDQPKSNTTMLNLLAGRIFPDVGSDCDHQPVWGALLVLEVEGLVPAPKVCLDPLLLCRFDLLQADQVPVSSQNEVAKQGPSLGPIGGSIRTFAFPFIPLDSIGGRQQVEAANAHIAEATFVRRLRFGLLIAPQELRWASQRKCSCCSCAGGHSSRCQRFGGDSLRESTTTLPHVMTCREVGGGQH
mmetsp:Transcript_23521/g.51596  ORF Transcript_23521/g.51596 Transcript_23521/m.51596 type:complete len:202 (-) Transcript_23521:33-638(-)